MGGLPRLISAVHRVRATAERFLYLDVGDLLTDASELSRAKLETLFLGLQSAGCAAVVLGNGERELPPGMLASLAQGSGIRLVGGASARAGAYVALVGHGPKQVRIAVVSLQPVTHGRVTGRDGAAAARQAQALHGRYDVGVLVVGAPMEETLRVFARATGFHVVVATGDRRLAPQCRQIKDGPIAMTTGCLGHYVADLAVTLRRDGCVRVSPHFIRMDQRVPESATGGMLVAAYQQRLLDERLLERTPRLPLAKGLGYVGPLACSPCHPRAYQMWRATRHASSFAAVQGRQRVQDPDCVSCHVTGFPFDGGYVSPQATPDLLCVGCESCHGPGSLHIRSPQTPPPAQPRSACAACHPADRSPQFDLARYTAAIRHW